MTNKKFFKGKVENLKNISVFLTKKKVKALLFSILLVLVLSSYVAISNPNLAKATLLEAREAKTSLFENCAKIGSTPKAFALRARELNQDRTNEEKFEEIPKPIAIILSKAKEVLSSSFSKFSYAKNIKSRRETQSEENVEEKVRNHLKNRNDDSRVATSTSADSENFFKKIFSKIASIFTRAGKGEDLASNSKLKSEKKDEDLVSNSKPKSGKSDLDTGFDLNKAFLRLPAQSFFGTGNNGNNKNIKKDHLHSVAKSPLTVKEASIAGSLSAGSLSTKSLFANSGRFNFLSVTKNLNLPKNLRVSGLIYAAGGINTKGADIDLGGGNIKASNVVYSIQAGENIKVSGPANRPVISASDNAKRTIIGSLRSGNGIAYVGGNGIAYTGGNDISIEKDKAIINNTSNLKSVVSRGGCVNCLKDNYISDSLTIDNGELDATPIGINTSTIAKFTTATTTNFRVTNNVGIGTSSPSYEMDVAGDINLTGTIYQNGSELQTGYWEQDDSDIYYNTGNVGIGTTTPGASFHVISTTSPQMRLGYDAGAFADFSIASTSDLTISLSTTTATTTFNQNMEVAGNFSGENGSSLSLTSGVNITGGNVGIGTTSPDVSLHVGDNMLSHVSGAEDVMISGALETDGTAWFDDSLRASSTLLVTDDSTFYSDMTIGDEDADTLDIRAGDWNLTSTATTTAAMTNGLNFDSDTFVIDPNSDRIGILDNTPSYKLDITGTLRTTDNTFFDANLTIGDAAADSVSVNSDDWTFANDTNLTLDGGVNGLSFDTDTLSIDASNGRVGIGTTTPSEKLNVLSDTASTTLISNLINSEHVFNDSSGLEGIGSGMLFSAEADDDSIVNIGQIASVFNNASSTAPHTDLRFYTRNEGDLIERARIDKEGNVGIGTTSPDVSLHVGDNMLSHVSGAEDVMISGALETDGTAWFDNSLRASSTLLVTDDSTFYSNMTIGDESADSVSVNSDTWTFANDTNFVLDGGVNGLSFNTDTLSIDASNGNVGIGTTSPDVSLHVGDNMLSHVSGAEDVMISGALETDGTAWFDDSLRASSTLLVTNDSTFYSDMTIGDEDTDSVSVSSDDWTFANDTNFVLDGGVNGLSVDTDTLSIDASNGRVGIGTTNPSEKLTLAGHSNFLQKSGNPAHMGAITDDADTALDDARSIYVSGKYAYVTAHDDDGVEVLDISDPANPTHVGAIFDDADTALDNAHSIYVSGKYAYVASYGDDGVEVLDISDPTDPTHVGAIFDDADTALSFAKSIYVSGKYAYVAASSDDGVEVLDISDPTNPTHVGAIFDDADTTLDGANSIYVSGKYAYVAAVADDGVEVLDISDPANPTHVGAITDDADTALDGAIPIYVSGKYAYVTAINDDGVEVLDISDPTNPTHVGAITDDATTELDGARGIYVSGKYAYVAADDDDGVEVLDISDPANPTHVGAITDDDDTELDGARGIYVSGKYAYVASWDDSGVEVLDIPGLDVPTAHIGDVAAGTLDVWENAVVENNLYAQGGLNVGSGGILTNGSISVSGSGDNYFAGNIGIGTTTSSEKLNVLSDTASTTLISNLINSEHIFNDSSGLEGIGSGMLFSAEADDDSIVNIGQVASVFNNASSTVPQTDLRFYTRNEGDLTERARITKEGNVGIGTTSPDVSLHVGDNVLSHVSGAEDVMISGALETDGTAWFDDSLRASSTLLVTDDSTFYSDMTIGDEDADSVSVNSDAWTFANDTNFVLDGGVNGLSFNTDTLSIDASNGNVGIGTTSPNTKLHVTGTTTIGSASTDTQAGVHIGFGGLCADDDGTCVASTTGRISALEYTTGATDIAENYYSDEPLESGEIVMTLGGETVAKADKEHQNSIIGIVSTKPGITLGLENDFPQEKQYPVALSGRAPIKVNLEGGEIKIGDPITISSQEGIGRKATTTSKIVGYALEDFNGESDEGNNGKIMAFVNLSQHSSPLEAPLTLKNTTSTQPVFTASDNSGTELVRIQNGGNVGIGMTGPDTLLTVGAVGDATSTHVIAAHGSIKASGSIDPNTGSDITERYPIDPQCGDNNNCPKAGDLVSVKNNEIIQKTSVSYDSKLIGAISSNPAITMGGGLNASTSQPVALSGRILVKVSTENGQIEIGDLLTSASSMPGVAIKATEPGRVIGTALESYESEEVDKMLITINPHWAIGSLDSKELLELAEDGSINISASSFASHKEASTETSALNQFTLIVKNSLQRLGLYIEKGVAKIKELVVGKITTKELCLEGENNQKTCIDKEQLKKLLEKNEDQASGGDTAMSKGDTTPPEINVLGNNPARVEIGANYSDLGVDVTDNVQKNIGYDTYVASSTQEMPGTSVDNVSIETSTSTIYTVTYTATDASGNQATSTREVIVGEVSSGSAPASTTNHLPVADAQSTTTDENTSIDIVLMASDEDGDSLTYATTSQPTEGTLSGEAPNLTYTPNTDYSGSDSFDFKVNDGTTDSEVATVSITINQAAPVNQLPTADAGGDQTIENTDEDGQESVTLDGSASSDSDGSISSYEWKEGDNVLGTETQITHNFSTTTSTVTLTVTDDVGATTTDQTTITITTP